MKQLHYIATVREGLITGVHEYYGEEVPPDLFAESSDFSTDLMIVLPYGKQDYAAGHYLSEYNEDGTLRPLIDRINDGLTPVPPDAYRSGRMGAAPCARAVGGGCRLISSSTPRQALF